MRAQKKCQDINFSSTRGLSNGSDFTEGAILRTSRGPSPSFSLSTADNSIMYGLMYN